MAYTFDCHIQNNIKCNRKEGLTLSEYYIENGYFEYVSFDFWRQWLMPHTVFWWWFAWYIKQTSTMKMIFSLSTERMSHAPFTEPRPQFLIDLRVPIEAFGGRWGGATHRFICLVQCGLSLASSNPSSLPRDANTLLRYPSTWQIRLLAGRLAGWQSSGQSVGASSAGQIIEYNSLCAWI